MSNITATNSSSSKASPARPRESGIKAFLFFFTLALLLHITLFPLLLGLLLNDTSDTRPANRFVVDLLQGTASHMAKEKRLDKDATVVESAKSGSPAADETAKYVSQSGSSTSVETKKRGYGKPLPVVTPANKFVSQSTPQENVAQRESAKEPAIAEKNETRPGDGTRGEAVTEPIPKTPPRTLKLRPDDTTLSSAIAGSGLADLGDLLEGDQTSVNSAAFRHASFFLRVQKMVEQFWHPDRAMEKYDPEARIIGTKDRVTTLLVVLRRDGSIHHLYTQSPSGAGFLDNEATNAVRTAGPFPNVPDGLVNQDDGLVKFLFQFTVEINQKPAIRIRKYD